MLHTYSAYSVLGHDADVAAATAAAMAAQTGGARPAVEVDWSVAYWNLLDMYRAACASLGRHRWALLFALLSIMAAVALSLLAHSSVARI